MILNQTGRLGEVRKCRFSSRRRGRSVADTVNRINKSPVAGGDMVCFSDPEGRIGKVQRQGK